MILKLECFCSSLLLFLCKKESYKFHFLLYIFFRTGTWKVNTNFDGEKLTCFPTRLKIFLIKTMTILIIDITLKSFLAIQFLDIALIIFSLELFLLLINSIC